MPAPGSMVLRMCGSPVPAQTTFVSLGAIASAPTDATFLSSNSGRQVTPLLVVFQMPPAAAEMNTVLDGPGIPTTSVMRPMKFDGPTERHRKPATVAESSIWAEATLADSSSADPAVKESKRCRCIDIQVGDFGRLNGTDPGGRAASI